MMKINRRAVWKTHTRRDGCLAAFSLAALLSVQPTRAGDGVDVQWLDGKHATAIWLGAANPGTLRFDFDGTPRDVSLSDLQQIRFRPASQAPPASTEFLIAGGGKIFGQLGDRKQGAVVVRRIDGESLSVELGSLAAIRFARPAVAPAQRELWDRALAGRLPGADTLITSKGGRSKLLRGRLVEIGRDGGAFEFGGRVRSFSLDKIYGVVLAEGIDRPAPPSTRIHLIDGTVLPGTITGANTDSLALHSSLGTQGSISMERIARIEFLSDRITYVSQLTPIEQDTKGIIHESWPIRMDQTVTAQPIRLAGQRFDRGIGCHSFARIDFAIGGAYESFVATIGIDDSMRPRGSVVFRVHGDGAVLFDSGTLTGRSDAQIVSVDVRDVNTLSLVVDFGDGLDLSDHAVWAGARLIGPTVPPGGDR